jgi:hypothetical protein
MLKKALSILALLTIATAAFASPHWVGTYWGIATGSWEGTIIEEQDPIRFVGTWVSDEDNGQEGTLIAYGEIVGSNWVFEEGDILDNTNTVIGYWSGTFPMYVDAYVTGPWGTDAGFGTWGGWRDN